MKLTPQDKVLLVKALAVLQDHNGEDDGAEELAQRIRESLETPVPFNPGNGPQEGYVAGWCGHRVAAIEWRAGFRNCERCGEVGSLYGL